MKVNNSKAIRRIGFKALMASRKRNIIAVISIALTSVLFTVLFTMLMSIVSSYELSMFKQVGGYAHGAFKEVDDEKIAKLSGHRLVKETGERIVVGSIYEDKFINKGAEISFMDKNDTKWDFSTPTVGEMPKASNEISMDKGALEKLGVEPKLGQKIHLRYELMSNNGMLQYVEDDFVLSGYWDYDPALPVHYINVSREYVNELSGRYPEAASAFRRDMSVMMKSKMNIEKQMLRVLFDLGYKSDNNHDENNIRIGVNWGYETSQLANNIDAGSIAAVFSFALLIIFTGYLIIYNIFRISVSGDIRFYGLLKTIGVTKKQLKHIIRYQAMALCLVAIPLGLIVGYITGSILTPILIATSNLSGVSISTSPLIFIFSIAFSLVTVWISSNKPGNMAGKVSPIEAVRYTEADGVGKKEKKTQKIGPFEMAMANLGRSKGKTALVLVSLSLSVVLLTLLVSFVKGFDMEKCVSGFSPIDFIVGDYEYFSSRPSQADSASEEEIDKVAELFETEISGRAYQSSGIVNEVLSYDDWYERESAAYNPEEIEAIKDESRNEDGTYSEITQIEGFDRELFAKFSVVDGNIESIFDKDAHNIALCIYTDDYGNEYDQTGAKIGDTVVITYMDSLHYIDVTTGEPADEYTDNKNVKLVKENPHNVEYTITAKITVPNPLTERFSYGGNRFVLPKEVLEADSGLPLKLLFYAFDAKNEDVNKEAEEYLHNLTAEGNTSLKYESRAYFEKDFEDFKKMFAIIGGALCFIIGLIGALNFLNTIMTGIIARQKEIAVLQAVGMTGKQLKKMLVMEGLLYTVGSGVISMILALLMMPFVGHLFEGMFWFYTESFSFIPVLLMLPIFAVLGSIIPVILYKSLSKRSVVERLGSVE